MVFSETTPIRTHRFYPHIETRKTPFYLYDMGLLEQTLQALNDANTEFGFQIHYAVKANAGDPILDAVRKFGLGADCVSGNEVSYAIQNGFQGSEIVFAGVGKTDDEIEKGLDQDIACFNCEGLEEILVINAIAKAKQKVARIAIRINPNIEAGTHKYITTGLSENKFGMSSIETAMLFEQIDTLENVDICGVHFHIGSQITNISVFERLSEKAASIISDFESKGLNIRIINLGGGLGIDYDHPDLTPIPDFKRYFSALSSHLKKREDQEIHLELGRSIVGQCGTLVSRVLYTKRGEQKEFVILDAGMTELIRPALYQSTHKLENITSHNSTKSYDVVGPVCESSDTFGKDINLPETRRGDIVLIRSTGAYGEVMKSGYNRRQMEDPLYLHLPVK